MHETSASRWIVYSRMHTEAVATLLAARDPDLLRSILRTPALLEEV
jgi:ATP/maltotriose-dependent transcriptional regulator MalT